MPRARLADFDVAALHAALNAQRLARGLSWEGVVREMAGSTGRVAAARSLSASTLSGLLTRRSVEGDGVLGMLRWLDRTPESFVPGHPAPTTPETTLARTDPHLILRWDVPALHHALDMQRRERGMTWKQVADEIGGFTPGMLTGLATAQRTGFPQVMRLVAWLGRPAVSFTVQRRR
jgi:uncharacterized protein YfiM (DUF2279 family)